MNTQSFSVKKVAHIAFGRAPDKGREYRGNFSQLVFRLIHHAAEKNVRLLHARIELNGSQKSVDRLGKTPQAVISHAGRQFELRALVEAFPSGIQGFKRSRKILLLQLQLRQFEVIALLKRIRPNGCLKQLRGFGVIRRFRVVKAQRVQQCIAGRQRLRLCRGRLRGRQLMQFAIGLRQRQPHARILRLKPGRGLQLRLGNTKIVFVEGHQPGAKGGLKLPGEESNKQPNHKQKKKGRAIAALPPQSKRRLTRG